MADSVRVKKILEASEKLRAEKSVVRFGLSMGWRLVKKEDFADASISPLDSTLKIDDKDTKDFVLSGVVTVQPFKNVRAAVIKDLIFLANLNLASFTEESISLTNQSVEGGIGFGFKLHERFALAGTVERRFNRELRDHLRERADVNKYPQAKDRQITVGSQIVTLLDKEDPNLFRNDNKTAWSIKFIFYF